MSLRLEKVKRLLPEAAVAEVEKDNELVIVPASLLLNVILGVALLFGVDIPDTRVKDGEPESNNQVNSVAALLEFPAASVKVSAAILIAVAPWFVGVNVAVYVEPLPEKLEIVPFVRERSSELKDVVDSDDVKVNDRLESFEVLPVST